MKTIIVINTDKNKFVGKFESIKAAEAATENVKFNPYFVGEPDDLNNFSGPDLVSIHNSLVSKDKHVKRFATKGVALDRTWTQLNIAENKPVREAAPSSAKRCRYEPTSTIHILAEECPRRKGSVGGEHWALYRDGMTVAELMDLHEANKSSNNHFYWDVDKKFIEVRDAK